MQKPVYDIKRTPDDMVHVIVTILRKPAAKEDVMASYAVVAVAHVSVGVVLIIDWIVGFVGLLKTGGIFLGDDGARLIMMTGKELMFDDPGIGYQDIGVIDYGISLVVIGG